MAKKPSQPPSSTNNNLTAIYGDEDIERIIAGVFLLFFGLFFAFAATRLYLSRSFAMFKTTVGVYVFMFFSTIIWIGMVNTSPAGGYPKGVILGVPVGIGALVTLILAFVPYVKNFFDSLGDFIGVFFGLPVLMYVCSWKSDLMIFVHNEPIPAVITAMIPLLFTVLVWALMFFSRSKTEFFILSIISSFFGSYIFMVGIDLLAQARLAAAVEGILIKGFHSKNLYSTTPAIYGMQSAILILFIISLSSHFFRRPRREEEYSQFADV